MNYAPASHAIDRRDLYAARLRDCVDGKSGLFARQIRNREWAPTLGTEAITSTAICLIGLSRAGIPVSDVAGDPALICRRVAARIRAERYPGGLGLLLWASGALRCGAPAALLDEAGLDPAILEQLIPTFTTMEVAWMVSGLLHAGEPALRAACDAALRELGKRLNHSTLTFRHASADAPLLHRLRGRIANFADQIYPVQAFAFAAIARQDQAMRDLAAKCARQVVARQGPRGQWWWHHDAETGRIAGHFPVYSVHQHSMAPMALRCVAAAGGPAHTDAVLASRGWLQANELGIDMVDGGSGIVWRSIERAEGPAGRALHQAGMLLGRAAGADEAAPRLQLNPEMRPYEWGWLLYSAAIESGSPHGGHIA
jgi:hypothetical protein